MTIKVKENDGKEIQIDNAVLKQAVAVEIRFNSLKLEKNIMRIVNIEKRLFF